MGNCYCLRGEVLQNKNPKSDIDVEGCLKEIIPDKSESKQPSKKIHTSEQYRKINLKENEIDKEKEKEKEKIKIKEKEKILIIDNTKKNKNTENKQLKKVDSIIEEEKKKPFNEEREKEREKIAKIEISNTLEIKELLKNKKIDLKREDRDKNSIKIVLVGDKFVGKSSIIFQFISNKFDNFYITTIFKENFCRKLKIGENEYNICLSSLSGDPLYKDDYNDIYEFADIFLLVFDVTNHESFNRLEDILRKDIKKYVGLIEDKQPNFFLVGNKCELKDKKVNDNEINEFCEKYNLEYFEVSAKNNRNIIKTFTRISEICDRIINN
jgi:small GTP-binding protein